MVDPSTDPRATARVPWGAVQQSALDLRKQAALLTEETSITPVIRALCYAVCNLCSAIAGHYAPSHEAPNPQNEKRIAILETEVERLTDRADRDRLTLVVLFAFTLAACLVGLCQ